MDTSCDGSLQSQDRRLNISNEPSIVTVVIPVHEFMPQALAEILRKAPLTPEKVAFAWRSAVGPAVDKASTYRLTEHIEKYYKTTEV